MGRTGVFSILFSALVVTAAGVAVTAKDATTGRTIVLDQNADPAALRRYYHTDQGAWLIPAAWLAALDDENGRKFMDPENMKRLGFLIDEAGPSRENPFGWPLGFTVSDPTKSGGIPMAGLTCAACHTGQIEYRGASVRIDGGQSMIDLAAFTGGVVNALTALVRSPEKRKTFIEAAIANGYPAARVEADFARAAEPFKALGQQAPTADPVEPASGRGRYDAVQGIANQVFGGDIMVPANIKPRLAPVSYPPLWDIWRLSWLQYNAFIPRTPQSRNIGEAIGVRARTHIVDPKTGALNSESVRWKSSLQLDNLVWMEDVLKTLHAPKWPADVLGPVDGAKAAGGRKLFTQHCAGCHGIKELPDGGWDVTVVPLEHIGTDRLQATNWAGLTYDATKLGLSKETPAYKLDIAINAIRKQLYADNKTPPEKQESDIELMAPCGYKARPLIGIWASPPFLHNGSVRTVFDLLSETRPANFTFGTREFDPVKLGYTEDKSDGDLIFDASVPGNSNAGHWWTDDKTRQGRIGPRLTDNEKYAIIEYLKAATYEDYPSEKRAIPAAMPCEHDKEWALKRAR
jgi:mono/diheme cytochrome c family protein